MAGCVISFASIKGGVGKTTVTAVVAGDLGRRGHRVALIDADPNAHLVRWASMAEVPGLISCSRASEEDVMAHIRDGREQADYTVVDLPGVGANVLTYAIARSDLVVVPVQASAMDLTDAVKTIDLIDRTEQVAGRGIPRAVLLTKTPAGIRPRVIEHSRRQLEQRGIPVLAAELVERTVFREMTFSGRLPHQVDGQGNAAANVQAVASEILTHVVA